MDQQIDRAPGFFVSGGTVPVDSPSYVQRAADAALFESLQAGKFCYVLNSRQMGKSSLCVRTMARLGVAGTKTAFVDLTKIGGRNVTPDQWYAGLIVEVGRALGLRQEMLRAWQADRDLSPMQRFFSSLRDVALERIAEPVAIFVDEIDSVRSLSFSATEFFAGIRECYNRRVHDAVYKRLTFCLLGVAVPGDLMADVTTTPFNIGERVVLGDFTEQEARPLAVGLGPNGEAALQRVFHWTGGHPFLTQSLASKLATLNGTDVDALVAETLFQAKSRETNINLADVGNRVLNGYTDPDHVQKYRADILSMYESVLLGREVIDDESNRLATVLKLSGLVRVEDRRLKVRNRIYERVFDRAWVRENMPGAEIRRQRRAYLRGVLRTAAIAAVVIVVIATLAWRAIAERNRANYEVYVATMNVMGTTWEQNNIDRMRELLARVKDNPARGWEWDYWNRMTHLEIRELQMPLVVSKGPVFAPNGKIYLHEKGRIWEYDPSSGGLTDVMPSAFNTFGYIIPFPSGTRMLEYDGDQTGAIVDVASHKLLAKFMDFNSSTFPVQSISGDGRWVVGTLASTWDGEKGVFQSAVWDTSSGAAKPTFPDVQWLVQIAPDGKTEAALEVDRSNVRKQRVGIRDFTSGALLWSFDTAGEPSYPLFSPDSTRMAVSTRTGWVHLWDLRTRREIDRIRLNEGGVFSLEFSRDGTLLAANGGDRVGRLLDVSGSHMRVLQTFRDSFWLSISPDKRTVATSSHALRLYDPSTYTELKSAGVEQASVEEIAVLDAKTPARVRSGEKAYDLDPARGEVKEISGLPGRILHLPRSGESWGLVESPKGDLLIVDFDSRKPVFTFPHGTKAPQDLNQFPNGRYAALYYPDRTVQIWDTAGKGAVKSWRTEHWETTAKVSPDSRFLAVGYYNNSISLWDTSTWTERALPCQCGWLDSLTFSPDSGKLLAATDTGTEVWDVRAATRLGALQGHAGQVNDAAYSPDGARIVTSGDTTVRVWDAATYRELTSLAAHKQGMGQVRFSPDGRSIIGISANGVAMEWTVFPPKPAGK